MTGTPRGPARPLRFVDGELFPLSPPDGLPVLLGQLGLFPSFPTPLPLPRFAIGVIILIVTSFLEQSGPEPLRLPRLFRVEPFWQ